ncbi:class GN sortase [Pseudoalteromonas sp. 2CM36K]|uniref:class GN sortase n=1 Tax=Pseudoalteromonas sp. 2CM36K TaxID=2929854 RepID=UPI0020BE2A7A|nr:class GN sortase [Pseudoalteromonas sp. 2CM36K]MCK8104795.1 class GN sortase [Pseudoalteromonas sp. 2CM36K]
MKKWLSIGLLALGLSLFGHGVYMQAKAWLAQVLIEQAWQTTLKSPNKKIKPWFYADSYPVAQIIWPKHNKRLTVLDGASGRNLAFAPSHFLPAGELGGADFGNSKGALIAGHNDTHFAFLKNAKVGEQFSLQLKNGQVQHYSVTHVEVINQYNTDFLHQSGLYLLTCYPFDSLASGTDLRWLVSAEISSPEVELGISTTSS